MPPLTEQVRLVNLLNEADELRKLGPRADLLTATLIPALFHEMFGQHVPGHPVGFVHSWLESSSWMALGKTNRCGPPRYRPHAKSATPGMVGR